MNKNFWIVGVIFILIVGYIFVSKNPKPQLNNNISSSQSPQSSKKRYFEEGTFRGTLPCADCSGVETELTFTRNEREKELPVGRYTLKEVYLGKNTDPYVTNGTWTILQVPKGPGVVYALRSDTGGQENYYSKTNEHQIIMLDSNQQELKSPFNFTLTRVK